MAASTPSAVLAALGADLVGLWEEIVGTETLGLETAAGMVRKQDPRCRGVVD